MIQIITRLGGNMTVQSHDDSLTYFMRLGDALAQVEKEMDSAQISWEFGNMPQAPDITDYLLNDTTTGIVYELSEKNMVISAELSRELSMTLAGGVDVIAIDEVDILSQSLVDAPRPSFSH